MSKHSTLSVNMEPAVKESALQHLHEVREELANILVFSLSPQERQEMLKMGDKTQAFVSKALYYAETNPDLKPPYLNISEARKDYLLFKNLAELLRSMNTLTQMVEDAMMVAGSEAYAAALVFHGSVKAASRTNASVGRAIYADLVQRFPQRSRRSNAHTAG